MRIVSATAGYSQAPYNAIRQTLAAREVGFTNHAWHHVLLTMLVQFISFQTVNTASLQTSGTATTLPANDQSAFDVR